MKKLAALLLLTATLYAQAPAAPKEPTVAEMKLQLAQKDLQIAKMQKAINSMQTYLNLYEKALGIADQNQRDQAAVDTAQKAVQDATPKPETAKK